MEIAVLISRFFLGLLFTYSGIEWIIYALTGRLLFTPPQTAQCEAFTDTLMRFKALWGMMKLTQLLAGVALLSGIYAPFGALILLPVSAVIVLTNVMLNRPAGLIIGGVIGVAQIALLSAYWPNYQTIMQPPV